MGACQGGGDVRASDNSVNDLESLDVLGSDGPQAKHVLLSPREWLI